MWINSVYCIGPSKKINLRCSKVPLCNGQLQSFILNAFGKCSYIRSQLFKRNCSVADVSDILCALIRFNNEMQVFAYKARELWQWTTKALCYFSLAKVLLAKSNASAFADRSFAIWTQSYTWEQSSVRNVFSLPCVVPRWSMCWGEICCLRISLISSSWIFMNLQRDVIYQRFSLHNYGICVFAE